MLHFKVYGGVSHRDEARVGVMNPFTVEPETSVVELTLYRFTEEGLASTT